MTDAKSIVKEYLAKGKLLSPDMNIINKKESNVEIIKSFKPNTRKVSYNDFYKHFKNRYNKISGFLKERVEMSGVISIKRLLENSFEQEVTIIGMVKDKSLTKNNNIRLEVEDTSGEITCIVMQSSNKELFDIASDIVLDEVIGIRGSSRGKSIFISKIILPDIPLSNDFKGTDDEEYLVCIGDMHVGGKLFLKDSFEKFIEWINNKDDEISSKVKYMVFTGDVIEGIGVYPGQEEDLELKTINEQMNAFTSYVKRIPKDIQIMIIPGNHDPVRLEEPQPPISKEFAKELYEMENIHMLSSPSWVRIAGKDNSSGIMLLLYHGYSIPYYAENIKSIMKKGGQKETASIMKFFLQRRHLCPTHTVNTYVPGENGDELIIDLVPNIFITGHIHRLAYGKYRGVININASCWSRESEDQIKRGIEAQPGKLPIINLKTKEIRIMDFYEENNE